MVARLDLDETYGIVLSSDRWHPGVIGIVASRIVEETARPAVLVAVKDGEGKGSGRSIGPFDLHQGLGECRDLLVRFGGHKAAAGVTVAESQLPAFAERFNEVARARLDADDLVPELRVDIELPIDAVTPELETMLRHFEPFGMGNAAPLLVSRGVRLDGRPRVVGQGALKLRLASASGGLEAIGWGMGWMAGDLDPALPVDVAYKLERDEYRGESRLVARLVDVARP